MATIVVKFSDGAPDYTYEVDDVVRAKSYAHGITTGRGFRRREDNELVYFPLHRIKEVRVVVGPNETDVKSLRG